MAARLDAALVKARESAGVPAVTAAVSVGDRIVWAAGTGQRLCDGIDADNTVDQHTLFQAASISKPITAMAVMKLVVDSKLDLDVPIRDLPGGMELPRVGDVGDTPLTLRHLLAHLGGTTVHGFPGYPPGDGLPSLADVISGKGNTDAVVIDSAVGKQFRYSGGGYCLVQSILTATREQPFPQLMKELVLDPLGMAESHYAQPLPEELRAKAARAHDGSGQAMDHPWFVYPELAAAGLWTTPSDLLRALLAMRAAELSDGGFLPSDAAREMLTVQEGGETFGLGWMVRRQGDRWMYGHSGSNQGFVCDARLLQMGDQVIGFAVMVNSEIDLDRAITPFLIAEIRAQGGR